MSLITVLLGSMVSVCHYLGGLSFSFPRFIHSPASFTVVSMCVCFHLYAYVATYYCIVQLLLLHVCLYSTTGTTAGTTLFQLDGYAREDLIGRP